MTLVSGVPIVLGAGRGLRGPGLRDFFRHRGRGRSCGPLQVGRSFNLPLPRVVYDLDDGRLVGPARSCGGSMCAGWLALV